MGYKQEQLSSMVRSLLDETKKKKKTTKNYAQSELLYHGL